MVHQYFIGKINLKRIDRLNSYLNSLGDFESGNKDKNNGFSENFKPNYWKNGKVGIFLHNKDYNLFIETQSPPNNESFENSNLIFKIMDIVEAKEIVSGTRKTLKLNL